VKHIHPTHTHLNINFISLLDLQLLNHIDSRLVSHRLLYNININSILLAANALSSITRL
jgi:hypothetical protein